MAFSFLQIKCTGNILIIYAVYIYTFEIALALINILLLKQDM